MARRKSSGKKRRKSMRGMTSKYSLNGNRKARILQTARKQTRKLRRAQKKGGV